jgi:hypothetical protein
MQVTKKLHLEEGEEEEEDVLVSENVGKKTGSIPPSEIGFYLPQYDPKTMDIGFDASKMRCVELTPLATSVALGCKFKNGEFGTSLGMQLHKMVTSAVFETVCAVDDGFQGLVEPMGAFNIRLQEWMNDSELEPVKEFSDVIMWGTNRKYQGRPDLVFHHRPSGSLVVAEIKSTTSDVSYADHVVTGDTLVGGATVLQMADYIKLVEANSPRLPVSSTALLFSFRISESECRFDILPIDLRTPRLMGGKLLVPLGVVNGLRASHGLLKPRFNHDLSNRMDKERGKLAQRLGLYPCEICGKSSMTMHKLTLHTFIHSGETTHQCGQCDFSCSFKSSLTRHLRTHSGERPYTCNLCSHASVNKSGLNYHMSRKH